MGILVLSSAVIMMKRHEEELRRSFPSWQGNKQKERDDVELKDFRYEENVVYKVGTEVGGRRKRRLLIKVIYCDGSRTDFVGGYLRYAALRGKKMKNKF